MKPIPSFPAFAHLFAVGVLLAPFGRDPGERPAAGDAGLGAGLRVAARGGPPAGLCPVGRGSWQEPGAAPRQTVAVGDAGSVRP